MRRRLTTLVLVLAGVLGVPAAAHADTYSAPLGVAIGDLTTANEVRTGYSRDLFPHWVDADGDGCHTRSEVLLAEADDPVTTTGTCDRCRYLREWVAVKHRWRLTVDSAEKSALRSLAASCTDTTITVTRAR